MTAITADEGYRIGRKPLSLMKPCPYHQQWRMLHGELVSYGGLNSIVSKLQSILTIRCRICSSENLLPSGAPQPSDWWIETNENDHLDDATGTTEIDPDSNNRQFLNCGLEIWNQGRSAWRNYDDEDPKADGPNMRTTSTYLSKSQRRELMRGLSTGKTYQLKQSVSLKEMVQTYSTIWNDDLE
jgi:hypothetical protein